MGVKIAGIPLKNPVMTASGTFGYGNEFVPFFDLNALGAIIVKTVTKHPREGNAPPRIAETPGGMLNSIGLQNVGIDFFLKEKLPFLRTLATPLLVNIAGKSLEEFADLAKRLSDADGTAAIELNISCPNVAGGLDFGTDPRLTYEVVRSFYSRLDQVAPGADILSRMTYSEFKLRLPELLLMRVDKIGMSASIEPRVPFLDHRLVEFTASLPMATKVTPGNPKALLKEALRGLVPDAIIDRPKMGFGAPMSEWLRGDFGRVVVSIRENEARAELLGYDVRRYKLAVFAIGAGIAGIAGILFCAWGAYVSPTIFSLLQTAQIIMWLLVGGLGTLVGPIVGCILIQYVTTWLGETKFADVNLVLGAILVVIVLFVPRGFVPLARDLLARMAVRRGTPARRNTGAVGE